MVRARGGGGWRKAPVPPSPCCLVQQWPREAVTLVPETVGISTLSVGPSHVAAAPSSHRHVLKSLFIRCLGTYRDKHLSSWAGPGGVAGDEKSLGPSVSLPADEVTMKEMAGSQQLRTGEVLIIVVVLFMWAGECLQAPPRLASGQWRPLAGPLLSGKWRQLRDGPIL